MIQKEIRALCAAIVLSLCSMNTALATDAKSSEENGGSMFPRRKGPLSGFSDRLEDNGIKIGIDFINVYSAAPDFGFAKGNSGNGGTLIFNLDANINSDLRVKFAEVFNVLQHNTTNYLFQLSNAFLPAPVVDSNTDLMRLTLEADFLDDRLTVEAGRIGFAEHFLFTNFCGGLGCLNSTKVNVLNLPGAGLAEWGARAGYRLSPDMSLGIGISEDNGDNWQNGNGWDWNRGTSQGSIILANLQRDDRLRRPSSAKPLTYEFGAFHQSAPYDDALYNSGWGNPTYGQDTKIVTHDEGTTGIYGQARKTTWSGPDGSNLAVYGGVFHTFGSGQPYPWEAYTGIEYGGFWKKNPMANIGFTTRYIRLSDKRAEYERNARLFFSGVDQAQPQDTFQLDLHGHIGLGLGSLEAGVSYYVNPNTSVEADYSTGRMEDGFVYYVNLTFDIGSSLGLARPQRP